MPAKRSRIVRSSSLGEIDVSNHTRSTEPPVTQWGKRPAPAAVAKPVQNVTNISKPSVAKQDQSCRWVLTLASPDRDIGKEMSAMNTDGRVGGFLESCYYCKSKIGEKDEVFMYSYLRAFCTPECRARQIALDKEVKKDSGESPRMTMTENRWTTNVKNQIGDQYGK